jgi:rod shape-determining protein MreD
VKAIAAIFALVFGVPMLQGALAPFLPPAFRPDLALLVVFALSLSWRNPASGLVLVAICGFIVDLFSGALLGQHALLSVLAFVATRALTFHVSMIGALPPGDRDSAHRRQRDRRSRRLLDRVRARRVGDR